MIKNKACILLLKNRLLAQTGLSVLRYDKDKRRRRRKLTILISMLFIFILIPLYSAGYGFGLAYIGLAELIPSLAFVLAALITVIYSMFSANGELFAYKDYDFLMALPIKTSTVIAARFLNIYIWNTLFCFLIMAPMGIVYGIAANAPLWFWSLWFFGIFAVCLIPTTIATIFGAAITAVASKFKRSAVASSVIILIVSCVIMLLPLFMNDGGILREDNAANTAYIQQLLPEVNDSLINIYPVTKLFVAGIEGNFFCYLLLWGISLGWYLLFLAALSPFYKKLNTAVSTYHAPAKYKLTTLKQSSAFGALYKKELRRLTGSSIYLTNTCIGGIFVLLFAIVMAVFGTTIFRTVNDPAKLISLLTEMLPFIIGACIAMCCTTGSALSLEGKNLWLLQSLPVPVKTVLKSKLAVNLTVTVPCTVISAILLCCRFKPDFFGVCVDFLLPLCVSFAISVWGLWLNLKMPNYEWESDTEVVKQSLCSMLSLLPMMLLIAALGGVVLLFNLDYRLVASVSSVALLGFTVPLYAAILKTKQL